jgi:hypothetical protein
MACVSYCDTSLLEHDLVLCNEYKLGGVSAIIVGSCGTELVDPSDNVEVEALLNAGTARMISDIRFALPAGSPITVDSPIGCGTSIRINEDRTATSSGTMLTTAEYLGFLRICATAEKLFISLLQLVSLLQLTLFCLSKITSSKDMRLLSLGETRTFLHNMTLLLAYLTNEQRSN